MTPDLAELRRLAAGAKQGPWPDPWVGIVNLPGIILALVDRLEAVYQAHDHDFPEECAICRALDGEP